MPIGRWNHHHHHHAGPVSVGPAEPDPFTLPSQIIPSPQLPSPDSGSSSDSDDHHPPFDLKPLECNGKDGFPNGHGSGSGGSLDRSESELESETVSPPRKSDLKPTAAPPHEEQLPSSGFHHAKMVQWVDHHGKELAEIREFEPSESGDSDDESEASLHDCGCVIL